MTRDVRRDLEAAGERPVPDARPDFEASLEERLLVMARHPTEPTESTETVSPPPHRWTRGPSLGMVAGVSSLVLLIAVVGLLGVRVGSDSDLELTNAVHVEVVLADGTTLVDPDGLVLPDAAVVTVLAGGTARIGDVLLLAGDVATIDGRRLRVDRASARGLAHTDEASPRSEPPSSVRPTSPPAATPSASGTPRLTTAPATDRPPTSDPATDRPPTSRPDGSVAPTKAPSATPKPTTATAAPRTSPPATTSADVKPLKIEARAVGRSAAGVIWSGTPRARHYILVATRSRDGSARDPRYPGSTVIGEFTRPPSEPLLVRVGPEIVEIRFLVVALDGDGAEVTRSGVANVRFPS